MARDRNLLTRLARDIKEHLILRNLHQPLLR